MQLFLTTLSGKTLALSVGDPSVTTVGAVHRQVQTLEGVPASQQRLLSRGKELCPAATLARSGVRDHGSLQLLLSVNGGGGDGGATCNDRLWVEMRGDILNANGSSFDKKQTQDRDQIAAGKASTCCISSMELEAPVMCCELGYLYNREPLVKAMLGKTMPEKFGHVKSMSDVLEVKFTTRDGAGERQQADGDGKIGHTNAKYICPVTMKDMNGFNKFVVIRTSRVGLSMEAIRNVGARTKTCPVSGLGFEPQDDIIVIYPDESELAAQTARMEGLKAAKEAARASKKAAKKAAKKAGGGGGGGGGGAGAGGDGARSTSA
eukprot:SAG22_NODE_1737_length_3688_cov_3.769852_3_plen_319_part_01